MNCVACGHSGHPVQILGIGGRGEGDGFMPGLVDACAKCSRVFPVAAEVQGGQHVVSHAVPVPTTHRTYAPSDVLSIARARLGALESELSVLHAKVAEAAMLRRMIAAADGIEPSGRHDHHLHS